MNLNSDKTEYDLNFRNLNRPMPQFYLFLLSFFGISVVLRLKELFIWLFLPNIRWEEWSELFPTMANFVILRLFIVFGLVNITYPVAFVSWGAILFTFANLHCLHLALERQYSYSMNRTDAFKYIYSLLFLINAMLVLASFSVYLSPYLAGFSIFTWPNFVASPLSSESDNFSVFVHVVAFLTLETWPNILVDVTLAFLEIIQNVHLLFWSRSLSVLSVFYFIRLRGAFLNLFRIFKMYDRHRRIRQEIINLCPLQTPKDVGKETDELENCSICWEKMTSWRLLPCNHCFHEKCLWTWLEKNPICPICRTSLESLTSIANIQSSTLNRDQGNSMLNYTFDLRFGFSLPVQRTQTRPRNGASATSETDNQEINEAMNTDLPQDEQNRARLRFLNVRNAYNLDGSQLIRGLPLFNLIFNQRLALNENQNQENATQNEIEAPQPQEIAPQPATGRNRFLTAIYNFQSYLIKMVVDFIFSQFQSIQSITRPVLEPETFEAQRLDPEAIIDAAVNGRLVIRQNQGFEQNEDVPTSTSNEPEPQMSQPVTNLGDFQVARLKRLIDEDEVKLTRGLTQFEQLKTELYLKARTEFLHRLSSPQPS
ncbi:hypothetical protein Ciccas_005133 [Cichlidogyrus casuarinus]|uniref:RING-type domain-containing protein n=1 Tax=Cichlidogyrus casuarinus TaxID=1844966 RepID=A0ABD2QAF7_9PLAT